MSNRRHIRPRMRQAESIASGYRCGHCSADVRPVSVHGAVLLVDVLHDDGCPVLRGIISPHGSTVRAAMRHDKR
jgi:hypothetical protein